MLSIHGMRRPWECESRESQGNLEGVKLGVMASGT